MLLSSAEHRMKVRKDGSKEEEGQETRALSRFRRRKHHQCCWSAWPRRRQMRQSKQSRQRKGRQRSVWSSVAISHLPESDSRGVEHGMIMRSRGTMEREHRQSQEMRSMRLIVGGSVSPAAARLAPD